MTRWAEGASFCREEIWTFPTGKPGREELAGGEISLQSLPTSTGAYTSQTARV